MRHTDAVRRRKVAVLGASGTVGQRFISLLANHPWFELSALTTSEAKAGKRYGDVTAWHVTLWEGGRLLGEQKSFLW